MCDVLGVGKSWVFEGRVKWLRGWVLVWMLLVVCGG